MLVVFLIVPGCLAALHGPDNTLFQSPPVRKAKQSDHTDGVNVSRDNRRTHSAGARYMLVKERRSIPNHGNEKP